MMRCGAKRYFVEAIANEEKIIKTVIARTPAEARKKFRSQFGVQIEIISVKEAKRNTFSY